MISKEIPFLSMLILLFLSFTPTVAQIATSEDTSLVDTTVYQAEEVVVTATRYEKKIIDIPYPVTFFDNVDFQYSRKVSVNDVLSSVPGVLLQSRYGNHDVRISIRGFGSQSNSGIRGVRILLDGIPESEPDGQTRIEAIDFNSVGRIEIVKGNLSSLYTNAPGGVVNFLNDIYFPRSFVVSFNDFGSFDLRRNGFKMGIRTKDYAYLLTYSYHNYKGYREHSEDFWHIVNSVLDVPLTDQSQLQLLGYYVNGLIRLPGSLTKEEFEKDPFQAPERETKLDYRRVSKKGRVGIRYHTYLDDRRNKELQLTLYGTIKQFDRPSTSYKIITRYGLGGRFHFLLKSEFFGKRNEFSIGGDMLHQTGPVEKYDNIAGSKGDILKSITNSIVANRGFFIQNSLTLWEDRLDMLFTGRYEKISVKTEDRLQAVRSDEVNFEDFTPKIGLIYKFTPSIALYGSYGQSFNVPAKNELDNPPSFDPNDPYIGKHLNHHLNPSRAQNSEIGLKMSLRRKNSTFFSRIRSEITFFNYHIKDEIV
ncbi:MAG: TonB-dependent receptor, partial [Methanobacteriota archaeon]